MAERRKPMSEINVVPYIDVMLVLLVIFMATAPLLTQGVEIDLPNVDSDLPLDFQDDALVVMLNRGGAALVTTGVRTEAEKRRRVTISALEDEVSRIVSTRPSVPVYVRADHTLDYGMVVSVMTVLQKAGAKNVDLITDPPDMSAAAGRGLMHSLRDYSLPLLLAFGVHTARLGPAPPAVPRLPGEPGVLRARLDRPGAVAGGAVHGAAEAGAQARSAARDPTRDAHRRVHGAHRAPAVRALRQDQLPARLAVPGDGVAGGPRSAARVDGLTDPSPSTPPCGGVMFARVSASHVRDPLRTVPTTLLLPPQRPVQHPQRLPGAQRPLNTRYPATPHAYQGIEVTHTPIRFSKQYRRIRSSPQNVGLFSNVLANLRSSRTGRPRVRSLQPSILGETGNSNGVPE